MGAGAGETCGAGKAAEAQAYGEKLCGEEGPDPVPGRFFLYGHSLGTPHLYLGRGDRWKTHPHLQTRDQNH